MTGAAGGGGGAAQPALVDELSGATAEQRFALMLLERVDALEARCAALEVGCYDVAANRFTGNGAQLAWEMAAPVGAARVRQLDGSEQRLADAHWAAPVLPTTHLHAAPGLHVVLRLELPVSCCAGAPAAEPCLELPCVGLTVRGLLQAVAAKYEEEAVSSEQVRQLARNVRYFAPEAHAALSLVAEQMRDGSRGPLLTAGAVMRMLATELRMPVPCWRVTTTSNCASVVRATFLRRKHPSGVPQLTGT